MMRRLICRVFGHRWVEITHRHDLPYLLDGREVTAVSYELEECARCDALVESAVIPIGVIDEAGVRVRVAMGERTVLERVEDAQAWNQT